MNSESKDPSNITITSSSQTVTHSHNLRSGRIQTTSSSSTRSTTKSITALLPQHAKPNCSTSEKPVSCLSDIPLSPRPPSGIETSFTVHSYPRSIHLSGDQDTFGSLSANNASDIPYHMLEMNSRLPSLDP